MSEYTDFLRWQAGCREYYGNQHVSAGDVTYLGLRTYDAPFPCPNGLPIDRTKHEDCPAWQRMVAKARLDSERISRYFEHKDRLIWDAMNDTESECVVAQLDVVGVEAEAEFGKRQQVFLSLVESFERMKGIR